MTARGLAVRRPRRWTGGLSDEAAPSSGRGPGPTRALLGQARTSAQIATVRNHRHRTGRGSADVLKCRPRRGTGSPRGAGAADEGRPAARPPVTR
ncbi:hypothetical protein TPA0910_09520 [Streptomyces hygroscopicus subsp. sporocinereus]|uniref:Uncharacterized protein n=1 Tax=Streptomyces hygroscopicus TaxID=1912 RepID=A0ABQ3TT55_STRHY|nr:hypothetical protein TPA0910_09520 [Streptomyces hygroscopicus]